MADPEVPIHIDAVTGIWTTDGLPMIYLPRHFFVNYYSAMEHALGREKHDALLYAASYKSAYEWSGPEAKTHGLRDIGVFHHYLRRLSQRGWGQFTIDAVDLAQGIATVRVAHSAFALQLGQTGRRECAMFSGSFAGCLEWAASDAGAPVHVVARETQCASEGHSHCTFTVERA